MGKAKYYEYQGEMRSLRELSNMSGLSIATIRGRLNKNWSVEMAVETPNELNSSCNVPEEFRGKLLKIKFLNFIGAVKKDMQPQLNVIYIATPSSFNPRAMGVRPYFTITLENKKPLIVYPEEFEIVGIAEN